MEGKKTRLGERKQEKKRLKNKIQNKWYKIMSEIDPDTLLEWLQTGHSDVTLLALEQLCTILLLSDNIDRCFER